ncbi:MAG: hypothetical protein B6242_07795 [Anaerolineaceae bacterium 4572_78]|nr:MAG: hypothetical protein B6242_07795 [Anaerolineaceae bacterium 4572_78]
MNTRHDSIKIRINEMDYHIVGGEFREMLNIIRQLPGRRFDGQQKLWVIPGTIEEIRPQIENYGYQIEGGTPAQNIPVSGATSFNDKIHIQTDDYTATVTGASFQDMLVAIKQLQERRFDPESRCWNIKGKLASLTEYFEQQNMRFENMIARLESDLPDSAEHASQPPPLSPPPSDIPFELYDMLPVDDEPVFDSVPYFSDDMPPPPPPPPLWEDS